MTVKKKSISDAVHGTIQLSSLEARVISTRAFQRLRGVKQLGLAHMVFPGADYSRFAHSLGVCHVTQRILEALRVADASISQEDEQRYRLAGLFHDIGHYPFSHAMEGAIRNHYLAPLISEKKGPEPPSVSTPASEREFLDHESVGKEVLRTDAEVCQLLKSAGFTPESIYHIFTREEPPIFANLISSDLDADRVDYLLRTAHHTGLPYGRVDLNYLLSQLRVDSSSRICLHPKALRTADHFLLGRYFDYQQVAFHKTVAALEWLLEDVIRALLGEGVLDCTKASIIKRIASNDWLAFNDSFLLDLIRQLGECTHDDVVRWKVESILSRHPPKVVFQTEYLGGRGKTVEAYTAQKKLITALLPRWAGDFDLHPDLWHVWSVAPTLTKVGSRVPMSALTADPAKQADFDEAEQSIRVLDVSTGDSRPIMEVPRSLMSVLSDHALYAIRVYVILPLGREEQRSSIEGRIRKDIGDVAY